MKFTVIFKTPDCLDVPCEAFGCEQAHLRSINQDFDDTEMNVLSDYWADYAKKFAEKFVRYGEYIQVEFDIDNGTATVLPAN